MQGKCVTSKFDGTLNSMLGGDYILTYGWKEIL